MLGRSATRCRALSHAGVPTDITVHTVTEQGVRYEPIFSPDDLRPERYDDELEIAEPRFTADPLLSIDLPEVPTAAGLAPSGSLSVAERKDDLRTRNAHVAKRLVDITGWGMWGKRQQQALHAVAGRRTSRSGFGTWRRC